jgi:hypothetical protein
MTNFEIKISNFLLKADEKLFTKRKYVLGLCRDVGHFLRLYPIFFRIAIIAFLIYHIWNDSMWESIVAKIVAATLLYAVARWIVPKREYEIKVK